MNIQKAYLPHLAGLRAIAIVLIVLFHLNGQTWSQGYLGVDVFLVITGYLLMHKRKSQQDKTRLKDVCAFLGKRVRRIMPGMTIIILLSVGLGMLFFVPFDEWTVCKVGYDACLSKANVLLTRIFSDYFAPDAQYNPLLHLWYLSIALQVYALYIVFDYGLQYLSRRKAICIISALSVGSLCLCYSMPLHEMLRAMGLPVWTQHSAVSYYATLPRLWEVAAGMWVAMLPAVTSRRSVCQGAAALGLLLILLPALSGVPLGGALPAVVGTGLILRYAPHSSLNAVLSCRALVLLGGISFSIYLVHMPLIVYWRMWLFGEVSFGDEMLMLLSSVLVGWGFWWAVEKRRFSWWLLALLWVTAFVVCRIGRNTKGFEPYALPAAEIHIPQWELFSACTNPDLLRPWDARLNAWPEALAHARPGTPPDTGLLVLGDDVSAQPSILLMGDSHALHLLDGLHTVLLGEHKAALYLSSLMVPFHHWHISRDAYYTFNPEKEQALLSWLGAHPEITHIIISQYWKLRFNHHDLPKVESDLRTFLQNLQALGKHPILMAPEPEFGMRFSVLKRTLALRRRSPADLRVTLSPEDYAKINEHILPTLLKMEAEGLCTLLKPTATLAPGEPFPALQGSTSLMADDNHLSPAGSKWLMQRLLPQLRRALSGSPGSSEQ